METIIKSSFNSDRRITIAETQAALQAYSDGFSDADNLKEIPIFIDTNALLKFYKISFHERGQLMKFLTANKERVHITPQIEIEFIKHRISHINSFQESLTNTINRFSGVMKDINLLKDGKVNTFFEFNKDNRILIEDNEALHEDLQHLYTELSNKLTGVFNDDYVERVRQKAMEIEETITKSRSSADIERRDEFLALISEFKIVGELTPDEKEMLMSSFSDKKEEYDKNKSDNTRYYKSFPGCGEKKGGDESGDYIIYHEILKFMKENETNVIFLTDDITKNDWLLRQEDNLLPYTHYIINDFICTGKLSISFLQLTSSEYLTTRSMPKLQ